jgi:hypothetical protein
VDVPGRRRSPVTTSALPGGIGDLDGSFRANKNRLSLKLRRKVSYALQVIWKIPEELKKEAAILFSLPQCGKSVALSNPDYLPERVKIGTRCISPCPSKGFAVRSSPLLIRRPSPHPKSTSHSEKRLRLTIYLPKALFTSDYGLLSSAF